MEQNKLSNVNIKEKDVSFLQALLLENGETNIRKLRERTLHEDRIIDLDNGEVNYRAKRKFGEEGVQWVETEENTSDGDRGDAPKIVRVVEDELVEKAVQSNSDKLLDGKSVEEQVYMLEQEVKELESRVEENSDAIDDVKMKLMGGFKGILQIMDVSDTTKNRFKEKVRSIGNSQRK